jgi:alkylated DNA repair dioxygenase AlkB
MQVLGQAAQEGFTEQDLRTAQRWWQERGYGTELVALHRGVFGTEEEGTEEGTTDETKEGKDETKEQPELEPAFVLIVRNGVATGSAVDVTIGVATGSAVDVTTGSTATGATGVTTDIADDMFQESYALDVDKKAFMRGRVVNKRARYNVCFGPHAQQPDYEAKKGRIVAFRDVPLLDTFRKALSMPLNDKAKDLMGELNLYYDTTKCGIGFHGDTERRLVVCARLGTSIPLHYQWFHRSEPVGKRISLTLHHGDVYVMSAKAVGYDWKCRSRYTLRHAAGCKKFLTIAPKKPKQPKQPKQPKTQAKKRKGAGDDTNPRAHKK